VKSPRERAKSQNPVLFKALDAELAETIKRKYFADFRKDEPDA
jgi:hypothetical protein